MYLYHLRFGKLIYSHEIALLLHDLTDVFPPCHTITMPLGVNPAQLKEEGLKVFTVKPELYTVGLTEIETSFGHKVPVYDMERTICDILRKRNQMDIRVLTDALKFLLIAATKTFIPS